MAAGASRLWTGDERRKLDSILDALSDAGIPFHSKELLKPKVLPWLSVLLFQFMKPRPTFEFHVDVFQRDEARAAETIQTVLKAEDLGLDDEE